ncbi:hypothetical protein MMC20_007986 [Loxospora ochrophaea]|nr:hypothetical protein [Loxospora ochrophaea]
MNAVQSPALSTHVLVSEPEKVSRPDLETVQGLAETGSPRKIHGFKWFLVVTAIVSSLTLYALDNTIVANVIPAILADLGHVAELSWLSVGFTLGGVCLILPLGKLYDIYDPKWLYLFTALLFLSGSALCGAAPTMNAMIVGRIMAGVGGNGMYLGSTTLIACNTTERERPIYLSLLWVYGITWGLGTVLGPVVGGGFEKVTWRWAFYINLCAGGALLPIWLFLLPSSDGPAEDSVVKRLRGFDFLGTLLIIGAVLGLILALNFGGSFYAWDSGQIIALFVVAGTFLDESNADTTLLEAIITTTTPPSHIYGFEILMGLGAGSFLQAGFPVIFGVVAPDEVVFASSWITFGQLSGETATLALASAVFISRTLSAVSTLLPDSPSSEIQAAVSGFSGTFFESLPSGVREEVLDTVVHELRKVYVEATSAI